MVARLVLRTASKTDHIQCSNQKQRTTKTVECAGICHKIHLQNKVLKVRRYLKGDRTILAKRRRVRLGSSLDDVESYKISEKYICKNIIHSQEVRPIDLPQCDSHSRHLEDDSEFDNQNRFEVSLTFGVTE